MQWKDWSDQQKAMMDVAGVPERLRRWWGIYGSEDLLLGVAVWNSLRAWYWPELVETPKTLELRIWRLPVTPVLPGVPVFQCPTPEGRPDGEPAHEIVIDASDGRGHEGLRLGIEVWKWGLAVEGWEP
ncbi:MAG: hypothetical protein H6739_07715 [Alphaproteobacteria bacterium]|nr:hypothetical protein [Alphaproteobacteria bacterium]